MISIGEYYQGPELRDSQIKRLLVAASQFISRERGPLVGTDDFGSCDLRPASGRYFEVGIAPIVNVVFYVPGSLGAEGPTKIEAGRFSRKQKLLLVAVPVPKDVVESGGSVAFVIGALREANRIAAETFARKKAGDFDLAGAEAIVDKVEQALIDQGF